MSRARGASFARSGVSDPLGKLTADIPKIKVDEETFEIRAERARAAGISFNEYHKKLLQVVAHGRERVLSLEDERLKIVAGMWGEKG